MYKFTSAYPKLRIVFKAGDAAKGKKSDHIQFDNCEYFTDDPERANYLRKNKGFGVFIFEPQAMVCENCGKHFDTELQLRGHRMKCRPTEDKGE